MTSAASLLLISDSDVHCGQMLLFDLGVMGERKRLETASKTFMGSKKAANTERVYRNSWHGFMRWCLDLQLTPLPASPDTMSLYFAHLLEGESNRMQTVRVKLCAIAYHHTLAGYPSPFDARIRLMLSNAKRIRRERRRRKKAITPQQVRQVARLLSGNEPHAVRNRALFVVGFALGWRRSELRSLDLEDVEIHADGSRMQISLGASKMDQDGSGRLVQIPPGKDELTCPIRNLQAWLKARGSWPGPLFCEVTPHGNVRPNRLGGTWICVSIQRLLQRIGVENVKEYGAHSLRAGMITAAAENGADPVAIMQRSGHRSMSMLLDYIRPAQGFRVDPLGGVL